MEKNTQQVSWKDRGTSAVVLLSVALGIASLYFPVLLVFLPALWAYAMFRSRPVFVVLFAAAYFGVSLLSGDWMTSVLMTLLAAGSAYGLYEMQRRRMSNAYTAAAVGAVMAACLYLALCLPGILSGEGAFATVKTVADQFAANLQTAFAELPVTQAENYAYFEEYIRQFSDSVITYVVPVICGTAGLMALSNLLFFRLLCKNRREAFGLNPMQPFCKWAIPANLTIGVFVLLIGSFAMELMEWDYAEALTATVNVLVGIPLMLQGLCVMDAFLISKGGNVNTRRAVVYSITGVLMIPFFSETPLMIIGCFEQLFHFRQRMINGPKAV